MRFHNKTSTRVKPLPIRYNKIDGYIKFHNKVRYLVLFDEWYNKSESSGITDSINHNFGKMRIDSCNSLLIEQILTFHNVIILIKLVLIRIKITAVIIYF